MAMPLKALSVTAILLLLLAAFVIPKCDAHGQKPHKGHHKNKRGHHKNKGGKNNPYANYGHKKPWGMTHRNHKQKHEQPQSQPQQPQPQPQQPEPLQPQLQQPQPQPQQPEPLQPQLQQPQPQPQQPEPLQPQLQQPQPQPQQPEPLQPQPQPQQPQLGQPHHPEPKTSHSEPDILDVELFKHSFKPEPWKHAHATFYEGNSGTFGGACGYEDVAHLGYGDGTAALSTALFNDGDACGACFEIRCINSPQWCKLGKPSLFITATNFCPPNFYQASDNGGWCNPPREHFDIAYPAFAHIAEYKAGIVPVEYRRVPCRKHGGIKFTITGNDYYSLISVWNVGGAGQLIKVEVKGDDDKLPWTSLIRLWGEKWQIGCKMSGQQLSFRVTTSDGRCVTSTNITHKDWQYGQTFEGHNYD